MAEDLGRATLVRNPEYERNGLKAYARALQKYGITPTLEGPYSGRPGEVQVCLSHPFTKHMAVLIRCRSKMSNTTHCTLPKSALAHHHSFAN